MKNICRKCENEIKFGWQCYECKAKEDKIVFIAMACIVAFIFLTILAVRLAWAKYAYNDLRCAFGECRIIK